MRFRPVLLAFLGLAAAAAPASAGAPQITDLRGDANALAFPYARGGLVGGLQRQLVPEDPFGYGIATEPASFAPGDLTSVQLQTAFIAVPVGEDGIDHRATGLKLDLRTAAAPGSAGGDTRYVVGWSLGLGGCAVFVEADVHGPSSLTPGAPPTLRVQFGNSADGCDPAANVSVTDPRLRATASSSGLLMEIPLEAIPEGWRDFLVEGTDQVEPQAFVEVASFASRIDVTRRGPAFVVGSDMPADVPCTRSCPAA